MNQVVNEATLCDRSGGEAAIRATVGRFYERVLAEPELQGFIASVSMAHHLHLLRKTSSLPLRLGPHHYPRIS